MKGDVSISWLYALPGNLAGVTPGVYMSAADLLAAIDAGIPLDQLRQGIAETLDEAFAARGVKDVKRRRRPPLKACMACGRGIYTWSRSPLCHEPDCRAARVAPKGWSRRR